MYLELLAKQGKNKLHEGLASIEPAKLIQLRKEQLRNCFLNSMDNLGNRFTTIAKIHGTEYINDAGAASPNATWFSLEMMKKSVIWIIHTNQPNNELLNLIPITREKVETLICIGDYVEETAGIFSGIIPNIASAQTMEDAVNYAYSIADEDNVVLYSPASELGDNEFYGFSFKRCVNEL